MTPSDLQGHPPLQAFQCDFFCTAAVKTATDTARRAIPLQ